MATSPRCRLFPFPLPAIPSRLLSLVNASQRPTVQWGSIKIKGTQRTTNNQSLYTCTTYFKKIVFIQLKNQQMFQKQQNWISKEYGFITKQFINIMNYFLLNIKTKNVHFTSRNKYCTVNINSFEREWLVQSNFLLIH